VPLLNVENMQSTGLIPHVDNVRPIGTMPQLNIVALSRGQDGQRSLVEVVLIPMIYVYERPNVIVDNEARLPPLSPNGGGGGGLSFYPLTKSSTCLDVQGLNIAKNGP